MVYGMEAVGAVGLEMGLWCDVLGVRGLEMGLLLDIGGYGMWLRVAGWLAVIHLFEVLECWGVCGFGM